MNPEGGPAPQDPADATGFRSILDPGSDPPSGEEPGDRLFTHFEREERVTNLRGRLQEDLVRLRSTLDAATPRNLVILNEVFSSTTLGDSLFLSRRILERLQTIDLVAVCVTFLAELAAFSEKTVSVVALASPEDPETRTYRVVRRPAEGLAHALAIAAKRGLTYDQLRKRLEA